MAGLLTAAGLVGLLIGSFLNVVVHRVPRAQSLLRPPSHCPRCEAPIRVWHNVPVVSWLLLRGRCASCALRISVRYPLVELGTAVLFIAVTARLGLSPLLPAYLYLAAITVALGLIDLDVKRLPNAIVLPSYVVGLFLLAPAGLVRHDWAGVVRELAAMAVLFLFYFLLAAVHPGGMGFGDVKLAGLLGLYLGALSWSSVLVGTFAGFLLGGVVGAALMLTRRATRRSMIPFGPFMLAGAMLAFFAAGPIAGWYGSLLTYNA